MQRGIEVWVVVPHDDVGSRTKAYAREKVAHVARLAPGPVLLARVRLARAADPGVERPAMAQATLDVDGRLVRAHAAARRMHEAVDLLEARLRDRLEHLASHRRAARRAPGRGVTRPGQRAGRSSRPAGAQRLRVTVR
jgi:ribosome-associated translation inhibitor RaiA